MGSVNCRVTVLAGFPGLLLGYTPPEAIPFRQGTFQFKNVNKMPLTDHEAFSCPTLLLTLSCALLLGGTNNRPWLPPTMKFKLSLALAAALFLPALVNAQIIVNLPPTEPSKPVNTAPPTIKTTMPTSSTPSVVTEKNEYTTPSSSTRSVVSTSIKCTTPPSSTRSVVSSSIEYTTPTTTSVVSSSIEYTTPTTTSVVSSSIEYTTPASPTSSAAPSSSRPIASPTPAPLSPGTTPPASSQAPTSEDPRIVESFIGATMPPSSAGPASSGGGGGGVTAPAADSPPTGILSNVGGTKPTSTNTPNSVQASCPQTGQCVRGVFVVAPIFVDDPSGPSCPRWSTQLSAFQLCRK